MKDVNGASCLLYAAKSGNQEMFSEIYQQFVDDADQVDNNGETFAHYAAKANKPSILELIDQKDLQHMLDAKQRTLLMIAAKADAIDAVKHLLPLLKNRKDCDGKTASVIAAQYDSYKSIIPLMCEEKTPKQLSPIFAAVINNSYHVIKVICDVAREGRTDLLPDVEFSAKE